MIILHFVACIVCIALWNKLFHIAWSSFSNHILCISLIKALMCKRENFRSWWKFAVSKHNGGGKQALSTFSTIFWSVYWYYKSHLALIEKSRIPFPIIKKWTLDSRHILGIIHICEQKPRFYLSQTFVETFRHELGICPCTSNTCRARRRIEIHPCMCK